MVDLLYWTKNHRFDSIQHYISFSLSSILSRETVHLILKSPSSLFLFFVHFDLNVGFIEKLSTKNSTRPKENQQWHRFIINHVNKQTAVRWNQQYQFPREKTSSFFSEHWNRKSRFVFGRSRRFVFSLLSFVEFRFDLIIVSRNQRRFVAFESDSSTVQSSDEVRIEFTQWNSLWNFQIFISTGFILCVSKP